MAFVLPPRDELIIHFAHSAYQLAAGYEERGGSIEHFETSNAQATADRIGEADVLVCSGFWNNSFLENHGRLRFVQCVAAGYDQFDLEAMRAKGLRFCNGSGVNSTAVAHHAMALLLALVRQLHLDRDNQQRRVWRPMVSDRLQRQDELTGKTMMIYGAGRIGTTLATVAKPFGLKVEGFRRNPEPTTAFDKLHAANRLRDEVSRADYLFLTCPLTPETANLVDATLLSAMKPGALLFNLARGGCVDEAALIAALEAGQIAGAGIDTVVGEPLDQASELWGFENVLISPHTGGETRAYEDNVLDILEENLARLWRGESELLNQIV